MKRYKAFTLTEILIAIAIVGVIAGLVLPILMSNFQKAALNHQFTSQVNAIT